jgi:hypothetical protein
MRIQLLKVVQGDAYMNRLATWILALTIAGLTTTALDATESSSRVKHRVTPPRTTLDEDSVNSLTIYPLGKSIVLRWHPQPDAIECFVVRAFQPNLSDAETLFATPDTVWVDQNILLNGQTRAFYWIIPRFPQAEPDCDRV